MAKLGCVDAILCDNAGDVQNGLRGRPFFKKTEDKDGVPERGHRSVFLYTVPSNSFVSLDALKPVVYPPQYPTRA